MGLRRQHAQGRAAKSTHNPTLNAVVNMLKEVYQDAPMFPGPDAVVETDKVENFINGRIGMMIDSMADSSTMAAGPRT